MTRGGRILLAAALALVAAASLAASAGAVAPTSNVDSPGSTTYLIFGSSTPQLSIAGTSNSTSGEELDIRCYSEGDTTAQTVANQVPVEEDGSFTLSTSLGPELRESLCRLAAVPTGSSPSPSQLAFATGPVIATSADYPSIVPSGPNAGRLYGHYFYGQQLEGAFAYYSPGECSVSEGTLFDAAQLQETIATFYCNDSLPGSGRNGQTRSGIQVDGANAYTASSAPNDEASGFPAFSYTYSQDPATGDLTLEESTELVRCPQADYPPTQESCPSYIDTGVRLDMKILQSHDGRLASVTDRFVSTDGAAHSVDTQPENAQEFGYPHAEEITYSFPGAEPVISPAPGTTVDFASSGPATVYLKVDGAADGDEYTGRGAIVFGDATSPATFTAERLYESVFRVHQTAAVPAGGAATKRFAYAQAYNQAEVEALAHEAETAIQAEKAAEEAAPNPGGNGGGSNSTPAPTKLAVLSTKLNKKAGTALIKVRTPGAGKLTLSGKKVKTAKGTAKGASTVALKVVAKPHFAKALAAAGKLKVAVKIAFAPSAGSAVTLSRTLKLIRK